MGTAKSRMKKVAPVTDNEEKMSLSRPDGSHLFGPSNTKISERRVSVRRTQAADCNSEGQESEFSAEDLAAEVDRILADLTQKRTSYKMAKTLYHAKRKVSNKVYSGRTHEENEANTVNKAASNIHEKVMPPKELLNCGNTESTATASGYGMGGGSSLSFPIMYDDSEEDLMNTIERDFG